MTTTFPTSTSPNNRSNNFTKLPKTKIVLDLLNRSTWWIRKCCPPPSLLILPIKSWNLSAKWVPFMRKWWMRPRTLRENQPNNWKSRTIRT
jgi:hypothetical protein